MSDPFDDAFFNDGPSAAVTNLDAPEFRAGSLADAEVDVLEGLLRKIAYREFDLVNKQSPDPVEAFRFALHSDEGLPTIARATWRQATSMGRIARAVASFCTEVTGDEAERIGALRLLGKASIIATLRRVAPAASPELASTLFFEAAHLAGPVLARAWRLDSVIRAVCGPLDGLQPFDEHAFPCALAQLAWRIDLLMSRGLKGEVPPLARSREMEILDVPPDLQEDAVMAGFVAFEEGARP